MAESIDDKVVAILKSPGPQGLEASGHGCFTDKDEYIQQRLQLEQELEQLTPIPDDDLTQTASLLEEFNAHWERLEGQPEAHRDLAKLIVQRVYIDGQDVVAMTLSSNYHPVLGHNTNGPTESSVDPFVYPGGSGGTRDCTCISVITLLPAACQDNGARVQRVSHLTPEMGRAAKRLQLE